MLNAKWKQWSFLSRRPDWVRYWHYSLCESELIVIMVDTVKQCIDQPDDRNRAGYKRRKPQDNLIPERASKQLLQISHFLHSEILSWQFSASWPVVHYLIPELHRRSSQALWICCSLSHLWTNSQEFVGRSLSSLHHFSSLILSWESSWLVLIQLRIPRSQFNLSKFQTAHTKFKPYPITG